MLPFRNFIRTQYSLWTGEQMSMFVPTLELLGYAPMSSLYRELLLLEGISLQGLGNWQAIAEHVGMHTKDDIVKHYHSVYVDSPDWSLPVFIS
jgi:hypothetical protein